MCRLFGFRSSLVSSVHRSIIAAENALAQQSVHHPHGWGLAYYTNRFPHVIRNDRAALDDGLLKEVSAVVSTQTLVAHVRKATTGDVSILNCHPFQHGPWVFAHNGQVSGFELDSDAAEKLLEQVDPRFRDSILGTTDSEVCFFLFLSTLGRRVHDIYHQGVAAEVLLDALDATVETILNSCPDAGMEKPNRLNFLITNGQSLVGLRYNCSLYFSTYKTRCPERDVCALFDAELCEKEVRSGMIKHLMVSSEPLDKGEGPNVWTELGNGEYVSVDVGMNFRRGMLPSLTS